MENTIEKAIMVCLAAYAAPVLVPICYYTLTGLRYALIHSGVYTPTEERIMPKITEGSGMGFHDLGLEDNTDIKLSMDRLWKSQGVKEKIAANLVAMIQGNTSCFTRIDVMPLYRKELRGHYRVVIYIKDLLHEGFLDKNRIWRDFSVEVEGKDCKICSVDPPLVGKI